MSGFGAATTAIKVHFKDNFTEIPATDTNNVPLHRYPKVPWNVNNVQLEEWIELYVVHGGGTNISVGNVAPGGSLKTRFIGFVQGDIYTPSLKSEERGIEVADAFSLLYLNQFVSGITFYESTIVASESPNAGYSRLIVRVVFHRDEIT